MHFDTELKQSLFICSKAKRTPTIIPMIYELTDNVKVTKTILENINGSLAVLDKVCINVTKTS